MSNQAEGTVERYLELSGKTIKDLKPVDTPCLDDHLIKPEDFEAKGILADIATRIVLKALYFARICRPDILFAVNQLA